LEVRVLKRLKDRSGYAIILACVVVISLLLISSAIMEYIRLTIIANGVRDALQASVISVLTQNYDEAYFGLREGYSGGYSRTSGGGWQEKLDYGDIYAELDGLLGLDHTHMKRTDSGLEYALSGLSVSIINSPFAPSNPQNGNKFTADAKISLEVPLSFGWGMLPPLKITIKTTACCIFGYAETRSK